MSRWYLAISTAACVMLFTMAAMTMLESQKYFFAAVFLFFAFYVPLQSESIRDRVLKPEPETGRVASSGEQIDTENDPKKASR